MSTAAQQRPITFEEFCELVPDGQKADLIDGVIYMASPDTMEADRLFRWLSTLLDYYVVEHDLGEVVGSRRAFKLSETSSPEPDIAFVRKQRMRLAKKLAYEGGPDLAIEIVSSDSVTRDYKDKRKKYEQAGVREYWIVDEAKQTVTALRLDRTGKFREVQPRKGVLTSRTVKGFWIRVEWLWQYPRPKYRTVLAKIEAGNK